MTANKMFYDLGYKRTEQMGSCEFSKRQGSVTYYIDFVEEEKAYYIYGFAKGHDINSSIDKNTHEAITQKIKELGWFE